METLHTNSPSTAGWALRDWCAGTTIARATFYTLKHKPRTVKLGRRTIVIESPQAYLARMEQAQKDSA